MAGKRLSNGAGFIPLVMALALFYWGFTTDIHTIHPTFKSVTKISWIAAMLLLVIISLFLFSRGIWEFLWGRFKNIFFDFDEAP